MSRQFVVSNAISRIFAVVHFDHVARPIQQVQTVAAQVAQLEPLSGAPILPEWGQLAGFALALGGGVLWLWATAALALLTAFVSPAPAQEQTLDGEIVNVDPAGQRICLEHTGHDGSQRRPRGERRARVIPLLVIHWVRGVGVPPAARSTPLTAPWKSPRAAATTVRA